MVPPDLADIARTHYVKQKMGTTDGRESWETVKV